MRAKLLSGRAGVTRTSRRDPRAPMLESLAAEFALLAQRRARMTRQIDLLERQMRSASRCLAAVQGRMKVLNLEMARLDPDLRSPMPAIVAPAPIAVPATPPQSSQRRTQSALTPHALPRGLRPAPRALPFRPV
jgi:hypothetical protein